MFFASLVAAIGDGCVGWDSLTVGSSLVATRSGWVGWVLTGVTTSLSIGVVVWILPSY